MATYNIHFRDRPGDPLGQTLCTVEVACREDALKFVREVWESVSKANPYARVYLNGERVGREELGLGRRLEAKP